ncbi:MAG: GFA family protein [Gammaproteobacteria bacterium]|nr:GFA family protein [Gammaproteobacteria bacterium]MDE0272214.1 GFA family protein [Gammaproteobacteria bacterium]
MDIDGSCLCGKVTWQARIDPDHVGICHCTQCQTNGASAFQWAAQVSADNFKLLSGELKAYVKTAESGNQRALSFCPNCGTTIHGGDLDDPQVFSLRMGGCRQRDQLPPKYQIWCRSALPWAEDISAIRKMRTQGSLSTKKIGTGVQEPS